jgi:hypothetical protein
VGFFALLDRAHRHDLLSPEQKKKIQYWRQECDRFSRKWAGQRRESSAAAPMRMSWRHYDAIALLVAWASLCIVVVAAFALPGCGHLSLYSWVPGTCPW